MVRIVKAKVKGNVNTLLSFSNRKSIPVRGSFSRNGLQRIDPITAVSGKISSLDGTTEALKRVEEGFQKIIEVAVNTEISDLEIVKVNVD